MTKKLLLQNRNSQPFTHQHQNTLIYLSVMADLNKKLESLSLDFSNHQNTLQDLITSRSQLETQYQENKIVRDEFAQIDGTSESCKIYKLVGPVLLPQDYSEAEMNVKKRIEFIEGEIKRVETRIEAEEKKMEGIRGDIVALRALVQT